MTTERQHPLVGCATCGTVFDKSWLVPAGDNWLCTQCAGAEIGRLRDVIAAAIRSSSTCVEFCHRHQLQKLLARETLYGADKPEIICLCGSTRFANTFASENLRLTLEGKIVLSIGANVSDASLGIAQDSEVKSRLDELHLRKIDLADRVLVINVGGYIGESTRREIDYARTYGKPVDYLESERAALGKEQP